MSVVRETTTWNIKWFTSWKGNHDLKSLGQKERKLLFWPKSQKLHSHNPQCIVKLGKIGAFSDFLANKVRHALLTENLRYEVNHSLSPPLPSPPPPTPYPRGVAIYVCLALRETSSTTLFPGSFHPTPPPPRLEISWDKCFLQMNVTYLQVRSVEMSQQIE